MLKILSKKSFDGVPVQTTLSEPSLEFEEIFDDDIFKRGLWLEYWEDQVVNFKFHVILNVVTIYKNEFSAQFTEEELGIFYKSVVHLEDLYQYIDKEISLEVLEKLPGESSKISEIWKHDVKLFLFGNSEFNEKDPIFKNYYGFKLQNTKIVRSLPYLWGSGIKLRCLDTTDLDEKYYWTNLCILKLYVTRKYHNCNQKCK